MTTRELAFKVRRGQAWLHWNRPLHPTLWSGEDSDRRLPPWWQLGNAEAIRQCGPWVCMKNHIWPATQRIQWPRRPRQENTTGQICFGCWFGGFGLQCYTKPLVQCNNVVMLAGDSGINQNFLAPKNMVSPYCTKLIYATRSPQISKMHFKNKTAGLD